MQYVEQIQFLQTNRYCSKGAGDYSIGKYKQVQDKVCGQEVIDWGCGKQHVGQKFFCPNAKCFLVIERTHINTNNDIDSITKVNNNTDI